MMAVMRRGGEVRRAADRVLSPMFAGLAGSLTGELDAVVAGRLLLLGAGAAVLVSAPLLHPDGRGWTALVVVSAIMLGVLALSVVMDWSRRHPRATLVFPAMVCVALISLSVARPGLVAPLTGVLTLCFAYVGLTQPPGTSIWAMSPAAVTFVTANGGLSPAITVRLVISILVWVLLAELLSRITRRQTTLTIALRSAAHTDVLTGVANRRDLQTRMSLALPGDTVIICDLDLFKELNDTRGHDAGDHVLADFGALLRVGLRERDYCARYGGEEFLLLLPATTTAQAYAVLERLHQNWSTLQPGVTFSAGIATCHTERTTLATLSAADRALYRAKAAGRNTDRAESESVAAGHDRGGAPGFDLLLHPADLHAPTGS